MELKTTWVLIAAACIGRAEAAPTGASFLSNLDSPQSVSMGGAGVTTAWGPEATGANPASLGNMSNKAALYTFYGSPMVGEQVGYLSAAVSLHSNWIDALGISAARQAVGGMDGVDASGNSTGSFGSEDLALGLTGSWRLMRNLQLGLGGEAVKESLGGYTSNTALAGNVGVSYAMSAFNRGMTIGASVNHIGSKIGFSDQKSNLPASASVGTAMGFGPALATLTLRRTIYNEKTEVGLGIGYGIGPVSLRGGFLTRGGGAKNLALNDQTGMAGALNGVSGGLGVQLGSAHIDYAVSPGTPELGTSQQISLTLGWGEPDTQSSKDSSAKKNSKVLQRAPWRQQEDDGSSVDWHSINDRSDSSGSVDFVH